METNDYRSAGKSRALKHAIGEVHLKANPLASFMVKTGLDEVAERRLKVLREREAKKKAKKKKKAEKK